MRSHGSALTGNCNHLSHHALQLESYDLTANYLTWKILFNCQFSFIRNRTMQELPASVCVAKIRCPICHNPKAIMVDLKPFMPGDTDIKWRELEIIPLAIAVPPTSCMVTILKFLRNTAYGLRPGWTRHKVAAPGHHGPRAEMHRVWKWRRPSNSDIINCRCLLRFSKYITNSSLDNILVYCRVPGKRGLH